MQALTFQGVEQLRVEAVADPRIEAPGDVIVRVRAAGVCGSDLHVYHGRETGLDRGTVMGHELAGEIVEVGAEVTAFAAGDRVVSPFTTSCGDCFYCRRGLTARCERGQLLGWVEDGVGLHGCQAEYVRIPLANSTLVQIPERTSFEVALFAGDVLATGFFGAESAEVGPGSSAAVIGCGPVGLMAVLAAKALGAEKVFAIDRVTERLTLAESFGASGIDFSAAEPAAIIAAATAGRGVDSVIEAVGSPQATRLAVDLIRPGGTVAAVGVHTEEHFAFPPGEAYDRNLTYRAGRCSARHYMDRTLPLVADTEHDLTVLISHRLPLADGARAYDIFTRKLDGCTKVVLYP